MHQQNVAHLDVKLDNIVVNTDRQPLATIEFNISVQVPELEQESWINIIGSRNGRVDSSRNRRTRSCVSANSGRL